MTGGGDGHDDYDGSGGGGGGGMGGIQSMGIVNALKTGDSKFST